MQKGKVGFARPFKTVQNTMTAPSENPLVFSGPLKDPIEQMEVDEEDRPLTVDDIADEQYVCSFSQNVRRMASRAGAYRKGPEWAAMVERMIEQRAFKIMEAMNSGSQARLPALRPSDPYFWQDYGLAMSRPRAVYQGSFSGTLLLDEPASYEELGKGWNWFYRARMMTDSSLIFVHLFFKVRGWIGDQSLKCVEQVEEKPASQRQLASRFGGSRRNGRLGLLKRGDHRDQRSYGQSR